MTPLVSMGGRTVGLSDDDWTGELAATIYQDRIDRGVSWEGARRRARRYRAWLDSIPVKHNPATCPEETLIRHWRGDLGFHTGQATVFVARQGAGKTNTISYLIENAIEHRPEWDIYTNVPFSWDGSRRAAIPRPPRLHAIASMSQLLRGVANTIIADRIPAVAIDEMDQATTSHEWATERSESWTKFLYTERHFRVRGPLLAYHVYEHVPLPLRRTGDLRGSYYRVVVLGGERLLACVEDLSAWWGVRESILPYLTLGLRGFDLDVDMGDLETHLDGEGKEVAKQMLAYLDASEEARREEKAAALEESRAAYRDALTDLKESFAANHRAKVEREEEIIRAFRERPGLTFAAAQAEFHASPQYLVRLRQRALGRASVADPPALPTSAGPA
jgi:hypothetical protein